jgi:hypothetical protein
MICSIHQPNYIPYIWLFQKIYMSDIFVFYDTAQYTKWDYHNRNKIKWANGEILLTIPVNISLWDKINEVSFNNKILKKHLKTIEQAYKKSEYFDEVFSLLQKIYSYDTNNLSDFNINTIISISKYLWITTKFYTLWELDFAFQSSSTQALVDICSLLWADQYLSWSGWKGYIEIHKFSKKNIKIEFQNFENDSYSQLWWDFIPYMSIIDLLFNEGKNSISFLK